MVRFESRMLDDTLYCSSRSLRSLDGVRATEDCVNCGFTKVFKEEIHVRAEHL